MGKQRHKKSGQGLHLRKIGNENNRKMLKPQPSSFPPPFLSLQKKQYKENQATQNQRSQDQTFSTKKERLRNPNVDSYPNIS